MKTGVYKIINILNNECYIGSAQISFYRRKNQHFHLLRKSCHHSIHLQRAWNKYGEQNFKFEILEECIPEKCIEREQFYFNILKPDYNILPNADSRAGTTLSPATKKKAIKALNDNRWKLELPEIRQKMSDYHKGRKKTKEHAMKVGAASKKKILQYNKKGEFIKEWNSVKDAENFYKAKQGSLSRALTGNIKTFRKFIWKYYIENYPLIIDTTIHKFKNNGKHGLSLRKPILQFTINNEFIKEWDSISLAAKTLNIHNSNIVKALKNKIPIAYNFIWKYKN